MYLLPKQQIIALYMQGLGFEPRSSHVHLPQDVITEILLRLPVKTLLRCRCVSKLWRFLISDPHFASSHFQLAASPINRYLYIDTYISTKALSIDLDASLDDNSAFSSLSLRFLRPRSHPRIGGSCRGFLFLYCRKDFYLWNPSTGIHKEIPASPVTILSNYFILKFLYGFGYDASTDDYLVVLGSNKYGTYDIPPVSGSIDLEIFSLRANKWKQIEVDSHLPYMSTPASVNRSCAPYMSTRALYENKVGSFLNGAIHWMVRNHETSHTVIFAFDLKERKMSEIPLPEDFDVAYSSGIQYDLLVLGGLICAWTVEMHTVEIWVMQEYGLHSSWTKTLVFSIHHIPHFLFSPICSTNCGDIVGSDGTSGLVKFNDKGQLLENHSYHPGMISDRSRMAVYTESLLSLPSGIEQA